MEDNDMMRWMLAIGGLFLMAGGRGAADDWLQFRGPDGQGHAAVESAPLEWSETQNVAWKTPLPGRGWSSPLVLGTQIWLTAAVETPASADDLRQALDRLEFSVPSPYVARRVVLKALCIDRASGRLVHDVTLAESDQPVVLCSTNSYASPTPVAEPGRLYCDFGTLGTICLDTTSGQPVWSRRLEIEHQVGPGSSPILDGERLILTRDGCDQQYLAALDKRNGAPLWRTERPPMSTSVAVFRKGFSTPTIIDHGGQQLVSPAAQWLASYDPADGRELWRVDTGPTYSNSARPVYAHGLVFCGTAYGGSYLLAIRPDGRGDVTQTHVAWQTQRAVPKRSSPLIVGDELYMVADNGVASCLDARSGREYWSARLGGSFSASPICAAGRIYFFGEDGTTTVIQPGREFQRLAQNRLEGRIFATPAVVAGGLLLRTDTRLYCLR